MATVHLARTLTLPYERVWGALRSDAASILTGIEFEVDLAGVTVRKPVMVEVEGFNDAGQPFSACTVPFTVHASEHEGWFPTLRATLVATRHKDGTGISLEGVYHAPVGALGAMADATVLRSVAERSVGAFFDEVIERVIAACRQVEEMEGIPWS